MLNDVMPIVHMLNVVAHWLGVNITQKIFFVVNALGN
jgi:hypothetical protein